MRSIPLSLSLLCLVLLPLSAQDIKIPPALGARASEKVDVTLDGNMLQLAAKFLSDGKSDEAQVKKLIAGLKSIYVRSFEFEKEGEYNPADVEAVRTQFRAPAWSRIVSTQGKTENSEVFVRTDKDGKLGGLAVIAVEPKEVTIVSIAGAIDPEQLGALSGKFGIPKFDTDSKKKSGKKE
jgi:Domain of unknown function (DUF4252)